MTVDWSKGRGRLIANGASLEWAAFGPAPSGDTPVIVLLHEGLGCVALWRDFPQALTQATGLPVFAYSRAGYGQSDPTPLPRPPQRPPSSCAAATRGKAGGAGRRATASR